MKETDIDEQRRGWVVRLELDARGVRSFGTTAARLDREGIPTLDAASPSPCWRRGDTVTGQCSARASK
jgi:poly-gamma-glutamate synthesis protein (capsule biosynthesis protein)